MLANYRPRPLCKSESPATGPDSESRTPAGRDRPRRPRAAAGGGGPASAAAAAEATVTGWPSCPEIRLLRDSKSPAVGPGPLGRAARRPPPPRPPPRRSVTASVCQPTLDPAGPSGPKGPGPVKPVPGSLAGCSPEPGLHLTRNLSQASSSHGPSHSGSMIPSLWRQERICALKKT
jgi:hypothetical protein